MRKIGIMGGTFDPIHTAHLVLGEQAYDQLGLEKVVFMPSGNPPHKRNREGRAGDADRLAMVKAAVAGNPHFEVSELEMNEEGYSYTYRTLELLREKHLDCIFYFIIGADSLFDFDGWYKPERIAASCILVAATRNHTPSDELAGRVRHVEEKFGASVVVLDTENMDISSSRLREAAAQGKSIRYYVPESVRLYIEEKGLYKGSAPGGQSDGSEK